MDVNNIVIFGIHLRIRPVAFTIPIGNGWNIYWYGIIIATGFLAALIYAYRKAKQFDIDIDRMMDVVLVTTPLAVLCARAYYVIFDDEKITGIKDFFGFGESNGFTGLAIYGGVIGALVIGGLMCWLRKVKILDMFDLTMTCFLLAQGIGRWGNFTNQEAFGVLTGSNFFGMESEKTIAEVGKGMVHPCFLYESIWCIAGFFLLNYLGKKRKYSGEITLWYGVWYGFERAIVETLRTDSLGQGVRVSCLLSAVLCIGCAIWLFVNYKRGKTAKKDLLYENMFETEETQDADEKRTEESK